MAIQTLSDQNNKTFTGSDEVYLNIPSRFFAKVAIKVNMSSCFLD